MRFGVTTHQPHTMMQIQLVMHQVVVPFVALHARTLLTHAVNTVAGPPAYPVETRARHPQIPTITTPWPRPHLCHYPLIHVPIHLLLISIRHHPRAPCAVLSLSLPLAAQQVASDKQVTQAVRGRSPGRKSKPRNTLTARTNSITPKSTEHNAY